MQEWNKANCPDPPDTTGATIKLFQRLTNSGKVTRGKANQNPRQIIDKFRKQLIKDKVLFTETNNQDNSATFNY